MKGARKSIATNKQKPANLAGFYRGQANPADGKILT